MTQQPEAVPPAVTSDSARAIKMIDVAEAAGVSRATVSLVMTESPLVAKQTRRKVLDAVKDLGYVYNRHAASFRSQRSMIIGLVVSDLRNPFFGEVVATIQRFLAAHGYFVVVVNTLDEPAQQEEALTQLLELQADGILLVPCPGTNPATIARINVKTPVILLTRELACEGVSYVGSKDYEGGVTASTHLIDVHGCETLGFFGTSLKGSASSIRLEGFRDTAMDAGVKVEPIWQSRDNVLPSEAYGSFMDLLTTTSPPAGLVCNSDNVAYGALRALRDSGYPDVEDCRVIGFDDVEQSALWSPSLTSVAVSRTELGESGAKAVLRAIRDPSAPPQSIRHESKLRIRESCGCIVSGGPHARRR